MKKIVILDLGQDIKFKLKNTLVFQLSCGSCDLDNCKIINKNFFNDKKLENFKKQLNNSFFNFYKFLKKKNIKEDILTLELFNQRNDKNQLFNKIFNTVEILKYARLKKIDDIEIITDDNTFYNSYKSIKNKNIKVINISKNKSSNNFFNYFINTFYFHLKSLIIVILAKTISNDDLKKKQISECCLSLFPLFYEKKENLFFKKKYFNVNFQITDETHLGNSLLKNLTNLFKIRKIKNSLTAESLITLESIFKNFFKSLNNYYLFKESNKYKFIINEIDCSDQFRNLFYFSLLNLNKLNIYRTGLENFLKKTKIKKFHYYLFEYNFGYYLCNLIKTFSPKTILVGYQHGIYSERLMWQNLSKKINYNNYFPNEIVCKYKFSFTAYKKNFKNLKIHSEKINKKFKKIKKYKFISNQYNVFLGLHDSYNTINELRNINQKNKFILNIHPKMKYKNKLNIKNNIKFNNEKNNFKNKKKLLSSTSTMPYQLYSKEKFNIIVPKNIIPLNPKIFDKLIFKSD